MAVVNADAPEARRPAPPRKAQSVRPELERIADNGRPWWAEAPDVAAKCLTLAFAPVRYAAMAAEVAVSLCFLAVFGAIGLWWMGYISDDTVAHYLGIVGDRGLHILQSSGVL